MTVAELLERISSRELSEWMAFYQLEPFGSEADFMGHAITASTVANVNRGKDQSPYKVQDFMPKFEQGSQSVEEIIALAAAYTIGLGGQDLHQEGDE